MRRSFVKRSVFLFSVASLTSCSDGLVSENTSGSSGVPAPTAFEILGVGSAIDQRNDSYITDRSTVFRIDWSQSSGAQRYVIRVTDDLDAVVCESAEVPPTVSQWLGASCVLNENWVYRVRVVSVGQDGTQLEAGNSPFEFEVNTAVSAPKSSGVLPSSTVADGVDTSILLVLLKNSDDVPIPGIVPTYSVTNTGGTNVLLPCTVSDDNGVSSCAFRSRRAESKNVQVLTPWSYMVGSVNFVSGQHSGFHLNDVLPEKVAPGAIIAPSLTIQLTDSEGNMISAASAPVTLTAHTDFVCSTASGSPIQTTSSNPQIPVGGQVVFSGLRMFSNGLLFLGVAQGSLKQCFGPVTIEPTVLNLEDLTVGRSGLAQVSARLTSVADSDVTFSWTTTNSSGLDGQDYTARSSVATIKAGTLETKLTVALIDTLMSGPAKSFLITASGIGGPATAGDLVATIDLTNSQLGEVPDRFVHFDMGSGKICGVTTLGAAKCLTAASFMQSFENVPGWESGIAEIGIGENFMCALTTVGGVQCVGSGANGVLGHGSLTSVGTPVGVIGLGSGVAQLSVGNRHSCARLADGTIKCWGGNGQPLGDGSTGTQSSPVTVNLGSSAIWVSAGYYHSCAVTVGGAAKCWGANLSGELGIGSTVAQSLPAQVTGLTSGVSTISAGYWKTCATLSAGGLRCWGNGESGSMGDGSTNVTRLNPVVVSGISTPVHRVYSPMYFNNSTCAVMSVGGQVKCWGSNIHGRFGDGTLTNKTTPIDVAGLTNVSQIEATNDMFCGLTSGQEIKCVGDWKTISTATHVRPQAQRVRGTSGGITHLGLGGMICARDAANLKCTYSTPGLGSTGNTDSISYLSVGSSRACILTSAGAVKCLGHNTGNGSFSIQSSFVSTAGLASGVTYLSARGESHSCAVHLGAAKCWGSNNAGQIGNGGTTDQSSPTMVSGLTSGVVAAEVNQGIGQLKFSCAVLSDGAVKCWGNNSRGQLGNGTLVNSTVPVAVQGLPEVVTSVSLGSETSCAITASKRVLCWGANSSGQVGDGTYADRLAPTYVVSLVNVAKLSVGSTRACALIENSEIRCWGSNLNGELGTGNRLSYPTPTRPIYYGPGISDIQVGTKGVCFLTSDGVAFCSGDNSQGALGLLPLPSSLQSIPQGPF